MIRRQAGAAALALGVVITAAACSGSGSRPTSAASASATVSSRSSTPSAAPGSSASSALGTVPTTSSNEAGPCVPATEGTGGLVEGQSGPVDVDGDGTDDVVAVRSGDPAPSLRVDLGAGRGSLETVIEDATATDPVRVLGSSGPNVFVEVGAGASATIVGIYQVDGCALIRLATASGGPETFPIGGTVTHLDGLRCGPEGILDVLSADSTDGETYATTDQRLRIGAGVLDEAGAPTTGTLPAQDPALQAYAHLDCAGVEAL